MVRRIEMEVRWRRRDVMFACPWEGRSDLSKSWLSLGAAWEKKQLLSHRASPPLLVVTHPAPSQRNRNEWVLKYSYILVLLLSADNSELTWRESAGVTVSGRLLSPIQLNQRCWRLQRSKPAGTHTKQKKVSLERQLYFTLCSLHCFALLSFLKALNVRWIIFGSS